MAKKKTTHGGVKALAGKIAGAGWGKPAASKQIKMTRVRMLQSVSGERFNFNANQIAEMSAKQAAQFVKCGFAERIPDAKQVEAKCAALEKDLAAARETIAAQAQTIQELHDQITALSAPPAVPDTGED